MRPLSKSQVIERLQPYLHKRQIPGYTAAIRDGEHCLEISDGQIDLESGKTADPDSIYRIASLTKPIAAILTLQAQEDGYLELGTPISDFIPEFALTPVLTDPKAKVKVKLGSDGNLEVKGDLETQRKPITVAHLITMTAGLGYLPRTDLEAAYTEAQFTGQYQRNLSEAEVITRFSQLPLAAQPGEYWTYNYSFDVLATVLARATGKTLPDLIETKIRQPLGLSYLSYLINDPELTTSYYRRGEGKLELVDPRSGDYLRRPTFWPLRTGLMTTARDYTAILADLLKPEPRLLSASSARLFQSGQLPEGAASRYPRPAETYGYGVGISTGRYGYPAGVFGWSGSTGVKAQADPRTGRVAALFTPQQVGSDPSFDPWFPDFFDLVFNRS
ncbi:serine hydrolase domain-containing protein [Boudabousia liubingyangii]|uniref:serine hydrolase domain-containing protein n=1 Tax=Boudabousia liubingyangii TaxID=1921764 RepID=UPI0009FB2790|nr:serine hydrolase domain-containing protein [Boudabousia liubingyangii]